MENQTSSNHNQGCRHQHQCQGDKLSNGDRGAARWQSIHDLVAANPALTPYKLTRIKRDQDDVEQHKASETSFDHNPRYREDGIVKCLVSIPDVDCQEHQAGDHDDFVGHALDDVAVGCPGDTQH